ncbi:MAG: ParB N-terminal domain-containing protein [Anaerolineales bacterium]|nr:ParB N-terminal domain-containing protein [Anaerolineales bacterium]
MLVKIADLRPNNWYINRAKLEAVRQAWATGIHATLPPVLITQIDGAYSLIDGHSRAFAAWEQGLSHIDATLQPLAAIEGLTALYIHIHQAGPARGIRHVWDLADHIVDPIEHKRLWVGYCETWIKTYLEEGP